VLWFTGLSGAGKTTISTLVLGRLRTAGVATVLLDGDVLRSGLNSDLGFSDADRTENVRRVGEVARLMADAGLVVLVALISPFRADRDRARALFTPGRFFEIHVDAPLAVAEARDPKGLYRQARQGQVRQFTGIASGYEPPLHAELTVDTVQTSAAEASQAVLDLVRVSLKTAEAENPAP
jgi:adenylyl-sulfate kinase